MGDLSACGIAKVFYEFVGKTDVEKIVNIPYVILILPLVARFDMVASKDARSTWGIHFGLVNPLSLGWPINNRCAKWYVKA